jgi:hypothetical protein
MRLFYSKINADLTLEGGYLQLIYGSELGLVGSPEVPATRITLCIYNHCLTLLPEKTSRGGGNADRGSWVGPGFTGCGKLMFCTRARL